MSLKPAPSLQKDSGISTRLYMLGVVVVIVLAIVGVFLLLSPTAQTQVASRTKGDPNAKIDFVEYSDFQ